MGASAERGSVRRYRLEAGHRRQGVGVRLAPAVAVSSQRFTDPDTDEVVTTFRNRRLGLTVRVKDVVAPLQDVFMRIVEVQRTRILRREARARSSPSPTTTPSSLRPSRLPSPTGVPRSATMTGPGYVRPRRPHRCMCGAVSTSRPANRRASRSPSPWARDRTAIRSGRTRTNGRLRATSAYDDAANGRLQGDDEATGQVDAALYEQLSLGRQRSGRVRIIMTAAENARNATSLVDFGARSLVLEVSPARRGRGGGPGSGERGSRKARRT